MSTGFRSMDHMVLILGIATALGLLFIMGVQPFHLIVTRKWARKYLARGYPPPASRVISE